MTGGSRGIGRAICLELAATHPVAVNYRSGLEEAKTTLEMIETAGGEGVLVEGDVGDERAIDAMFSHAEEALGPVTVLVNNAGIRRDALAPRMSEAAWHEVMNTNLYGAFACSRRALRSMIRAQWGRIVMVSSVAGTHGIPGQANYCAAKAGLIGMTRSLAREVGRKNITVNAVAPGLVETQMTQGLSEARTSDIVSQIPLGRAGSTEEIANVVAFLCSDKASYVSGSILVADGGMTA